jgi:cytochrome P450
MPSWDSSDPFADARKLSGVLEIDFEDERIPLILRFKDVRQAAGDFGTFSSNAPFRVPIPSEEHVRKERQLPIETDPPEHTDYRAIVQPFFSRPKRPEMIAAVDSLVEELLADIVDRESVDIIHHFALPLQSKALALLLDMPEESADEWIQWGTHVFHGHDAPSEEKGDRLNAYVHEQFDRAESDPGADFFSALSRATFRGRPLTREEKVGFAVLTFAGGRDTVINILSFALAHLADCPADLIRLRSKPVLIRSAIEEFVRFASPLTHIGRVCPHDTEINGVDVPADNRVSLCWASANRDETVFESPGEVRIDRKRNAHVGFGAGAHMCLGASQARLILRTVLTQICDKGLELTVLDHTPKYEEWPGYKRQVGFDELRMSVAAGVID